MATYQGQERRRAQRTKLVTFCPAFFSLNGVQHEAMMIDVSELGAGFSLTAKASIKLTRGLQLSLTIRTPYGDSACEGALIWSRTTAENTTWGIRFTQLSSDAKDPLRCLIDSPF